MAPALVQIRPLFTLMKHDLGLLFFAYEHVVLVGELKMLACGLCMAAYKKCSSGSKNCVCRSLQSSSLFLFQSYFLIRSSDHHLPH